MVQIGPRRVAAPPNKPGFNQPIWGTVIDTPQRVAAPANASQALESVKRKGGTAVTSYRRYIERLRDEFECVLNNLALNGKHLPADHPFDWRVRRALEGIAGAYPNATAEQVADSRLSLERQIHRWPAHRKRSGYPAA